MPYASPSASLMAVANPLGHPAQPPSSISTRVNRAGGHRRTQSLSFDIVDVKNSSSAFTPLAGVPRRARSNGNAKRPPMFHLGPGEDDNSSGDNTAKHSTLPPKAPSSPPEEVNSLGLTMNGQGLRVDVTNLPPSGLDSSVNESENVPFPCLSSPRDESSQAPPSTLRQQSADSIHTSDQSSPKSPIVRKSNGQVLKSSLKVRSTAFRAPTFLVNLSDADATSRYCFLVLFVKREYSFIRLSARQRATGFHTLRTHHPLPQGCYLRR